MSRSYRIDRGMIYREVDGEIDGEMMDEDLWRCGVGTRFGARKVHHAGVGLCFWTRCAV